MRSWFIGSFAPVNSLSPGPNSETRLYLSRSIVKKTGIFVEAIVGFGPVRGLVRNVRYASAVAAAAGSGRQVGDDFVVLGAFVEAG
jgi:hypothetical protein